MLSVRILCYYVFIYLYCLCYTVWREIFASINFGESPTNMPGNFFFFCNRVITYYHTSNNFTLCTTQNGDYFVKNLCHSAWEDQRRRCANICHMALPARASQCQYENSGTPASLISHALNEILALGIPRYTYGQLVATAFFCIVGKEIQSKYREKNKTLN